MSFAAALACSACWGAPDSPLTQGAKAGVFVLLAVIVLVLGGILSVMILWIKRARMLEASEQYDAKRPLDLFPHGS